MARKKKAKEEVAAPAGVVPTGPPWRRIAWRDLEEYCRRKRERTISVQLSCQDLEAVIPLLVGRARERRETANRMITEHYCLGCLEEAAHADALAELLRGLARAWEQANEIPSTPDEHKEDGHEP